MAKNLQSRMIFLKWSKNRKFKKNGNEIMRKMYLNFMEKA